MDAASSERSHAPGAEEIARLERLAAELADPLVFPALAEAHRRAGRPDEAERVAREGLARHPDLIAGRVALGLALLDAGRFDEARGELQRVLADVPDHVLAIHALEHTEIGGPDVEELESEPVEEIPLGALADGEVEDALASAVPDPEETIDADRIAQEAMREANLEHPEGLLTHPESPFATRTLAELLERQGDARGAEAIRARLRSRRPTPAEATSAAEAEGRGRRAEWIATLERWLENLRRGRA